MKGKYLLVPALLGWMFVASPAAMAGTAIQEMVNIILTLHHYPSDSEKVTLRKIIDDSATSSDEREIANALLHMRHTVSDSDKAKLLEIANNGSATVADRKVAEILAHIHHKASSEDKQELEMLK
jgi:hypothetical protein